MHVENYSGDKVVRSESIVMGIIKLNPTVSCHLLNVCIILQIGTWNILKQSHENFPDETGSTADLNICDCKVGECDLIATTLKLYMSCHLSNVYSKFHIDISNM